MDINVHSRVDEYFRFLVAEIKKMLNKAREAIENPDMQKNILSSMLIKDDYVENLKIVIKQKGYEQINNDAKRDDLSVSRVMALNTITDNLEKIADYTVQIVKQLAYFTEPEFISNFNYNSYFSSINRAMEKITGAISDGNEKLSMDICRSEFELDEYYLRDFNIILKELQTGTNMENLLSSMFIFRYLERIGDSLLNIGEAIISRATGNKIRIDQYIALKSSMEAGSEISFNIKKIGFDTKSGCQIGLISSPSEKIDGCIYKEGNKSKISMEKQSLEYWNSLFPGTVPLVHDYNEYGEHASLLMEVMKGTNLKQLALNDEYKKMQKGFDLLCDLLDWVWSETIISEPCSPSFVSQSIRRIDDVYTVHSSLINSYQIENLVIPDINEKLDSISFLDEELQAPFSTLTHGDLNLDNIIYDDSIDDIRLIDLYRSKKGDYVQDVSVFIVSNFRLPVFRYKARKKINRIIQEFLSFARDFAHKHHDNTFSKRLALGLARSYITSTRFELKDNFARMMYLRGLYLIDKIISDQRPHEEFTFNERIMEY